MGNSLTAMLRKQAYRAATFAYSRYRTSGVPRPGLRILMYHAIGTPVAGDIHGLYSMSVARFEEQMRFLATNYANHLVQLDKSSLDVGSSLHIALTFDDGYRDNLLAAAPLLISLGIPFTVFICTGAVAEKRAGFLNRDDVKHLAVLPGAQIGSHSINHPHLTESNDRNLHNELVGSKYYLEDLLGREIDMISYPNGSVNDRVRNMANQVGYHLGACSRFDVNPPDRDPLLLCRTDIWAQDDMLIFDQKLRGDWDWYRWRSTDRSNK